MDATAKLAGLCPVLNCVVSGPVSLNESLGNIEFECEHV